MDDIDLEIILPWQPPRDSHAIVYENLGIVADLKGPNRGVDGDTLLMFTTAPFFLAVFQKLGNGAGEAFLRMMSALWKRGEPKEAGSSSEKADIHVEITLQDPPYPTIVIESRGNKTAEAMNVLFQMDFSRCPDHAVLTWDEHVGLWRPERDTE